MTIFRVSVLKGVRGMFQKVREDKVEEINSAITMVMGEVDNLNISGEWVWQVIMVDQCVLWFIGYVIAQWTLVMKVAVFYCAQSLQVMFWNLQTIMMDFILGLQTGYSLWSYGLLRSCINNEWKDYKIVSLQTVYLLL